MDTPDFHKKWRQVKTEMKLRYIQLTEEDLNFDPANEDSLISRLQRCLGKSRTDLYRELNTISKRH